MLCLQVMNTASNNVLSIVGEDENNIHPSVLKKIIAVERMYMLERSQMYRHDCSFGIDAFVKGVHVVTFIWMSHEQRLSFGKFFTESTRLIQNHIMRQYLSTELFNIILTVPSPTFILSSCGIMYVNYGNTPIALSRAINCADRSIKDTSSNASRLFYRVALSAVRIKHDVQLVGVNIVIENSGRLLQIPRNYDPQCPSFDCTGQTDCKVWVRHVIQSPKIISSCMPTTECYVCSVLHSVFHHRRSTSRHLEVVHYPFCFARRRKETLVRIKVENTAEVTTYFDIVTADDQSHYFDRRMITDIVVRCAKVDGFLIVNDSIVSFNNSHKINVQSKVEVMSSSIRVFVHTEIKDVDANDFGDYMCELKCVFGSHAEYSGLYECSQYTRFSVIADSWRRDELIRTHVNEKLEKLVKSMKDAVEAVTENVTNTICDLEYQNCYLLLISFFMSILFLCFVPHIIHRLAERRRNKDIGFVDAVLKAVRDNRDNRTLKFDVFLSYSSADKVWVDDLYEFLKSRGYRVCYDVADFPYGCYIPQAIADAVSGSKKVIAIVSPSYVKSRWTEMEYVMSVRQILDMEAPRDSLLPILYKPCKMPLQLKCFRYIDYSEFCFKPRSRRHIYDQICSIFFRQTREVSHPETCDENFRAKLVECLGKPQVCLKKIKDE